MYSILRARVSNRTNCISICPTFWCKCNIFPIHFPAKRGTWASVTSLPDSSVRADLATKLELISLKNLSELLFSLHGKFWTYDYIFRLSSTRQYRCTIIVISIIAYWRTSATYHYIIKAILESVWIIYYTFTE